MPKCDKARPGKGYLGATIVIRPRRIGERMSTMAHGLIACHVLDRTEPERLDL